MRICKKEEKKLLRELRYITEREISVKHYRSIDSTNDEAKRQENGALPVLLIADRQTRGKGRMGRSFYSPEESGLYMSLLFSPSEQGESFMRLTSVAAVALRRAIADVFSLSTDIKWVNDIYLDGKKVAGILCESFEREGEKRVVIGIGVNLSTKDFPKELENIAGSLGDSADKKYALAARITANIFETIDNAREGNLNIWTNTARRRSFLGKR